MGITILDVAKRAGVSKSTVSRVLTNDPKVGADTRVRIEQAIRETGYRPNALARGLVHGHTHTLGLVVHDLTNPFFALLARGARLAAQARGYNILLTESGGDIGLERECLARLSERRVDGLLLASICTVEETLSAVLRAGQDIVLVNSTAGGDTISSVGTDNRRGGFLAAEHLVQLGHRRIAFLGDLKSAESTMARLEGYRMAQREVAIPVDSALIFEDLRHLDRVQSAVEQVMSLPDPPTAIFCVNDYFAIAALQTLMRLGVHVPDDVAVVGYDDTPLAAWLSVPLTSVEQPKEEQGELAADLLIDQIEKRSRAVRKVYLQPRLIPRQSSIGRLPGLDEAQFDPCAF